MLSSEIASRGLSFLKDRASYAALITMSCRMRPIGLFQLQRSPFEQLAPAFAVYNGEVLDDICNPLVSIEVNLKDITLRLMS